MGLGPTAAAQAGGGAPGGPDSTALRRRAGAAAQVFVEDPAQPVLDSDDAHHLVRVLRLRPGEPVVAADGRGRWCMCRLAGGPAATAARDAGLDGAGLLCPDGPVESELPARPALTVAFVPAKGDRPEWVVQKLTELGVDRIVPLTSERSVVRWEGQRADRGVDRLRKVARQAAAQSRRCWLPEVSGVRPFEWVSSAGGWLAELGGRPPGPDTTLVAVGPEGGWSPGELAAAGGRTMGLGPTVLRSETAAVAAGALLVALRAGTVAGT